MPPHLDRISPPRGARKGAPVGGIYARPWPGALAVGGLLIGLSEAAGARGSSTRTAGASAWSRAEVVGARPCRDASPACDAIGGAQRPPKISDANRKAVASRAPLREAARQSAWIGRPDDRVPGKCGARHNSGVRHALTGRFAPHPRVRTWYICLHSPSVAHVLSCFNSFRATTLMRVESRGGPSKITF